MLRSITLLVLLCACSCFVRAEDPPIFSGPQVGEPLPSLIIKSLNADDGDKEIDVLKDSGRRPVVILFAHQVTRPSQQVIRTVSEYCKSLEGKVHYAIVFLTEDVTKTRQWAANARQSMPKEGILGVSSDGLEGPGKYGLNRNVTLTVLVAKEGKVAANFALVQPSDAVDTPKVARAVAEAAGVKVPTSEELAKIIPAMANPAMTRGVNEAEVRALLSPVIQKASSKEQIDAAASKLEAKAKDDAAFRKDIGDRARRIVEGGALSNYGNETGQAYLKKWSESFK